MSVLSDRDIRAALEEGRIRIDPYDPHDLQPSSVDLHRFRLLQRTKTGFGGLRAAREPLPVCRTEIERTFEHRSDGPCVNPDFLLSAHRDGYRVTVAPGAERG